MAFDEPMPTPDGNVVDTMPLWEAYWVAGLGGASGVMAGKLGELAPSINSGARTVSAATGTAFVRGFYITNPSATYTASVPAASAADRVDRLVLRLDRTASVAANWLKPVIIQGTSGSLTPPAIQSSETASWDLPIARWTSKADGSLAGLVDERYRDGGQFLTFSSKARPSASPPRQGLETDTGLPLYSDGSTWHYYDSDTGWVTLTLGNTAWVPSPLTSVARLRNGVATLRVTVKRALSTFAKDDPDGSLVCTLPSQFRPGVDQYGTVVFSSGIGSARVDVGTDGTVVLKHATADVTVNHTAQFSISYPVG